MFFFSYDENKDNYLNLDEFKKLTIETDYFPKKIEDNKLFLEQNALEITKFLAETVAYFLIKI